MSLAGRTLFITGASRGIGLAIAKRAAADGANVVVAAKTTEPHPKLPGTIYTAADEVEKAGGKALPLVLDIRDEDAVAKAVDTAAQHFGGIDICVNNASAISNTGTLRTKMKTYDLMHTINTRGTFVTSQACLPHLLKAPEGTAHVLNLSPPLNMDGQWFAGAGVAYTMAKYGMSMCVLGMAEEFRGKVAFNALWPRTGIATAAIDMLTGEAGMRASRKPEIMGDAAHAILTSDARTFTGNFVIDDEILTERGATQADLREYQYDPDAKALMPDFFLGDAQEVMAFFAKK